MLYQQQALRCVHEGFYVSLYRVGSFRYGSADGDHHTFHEGKTPDQGGVGFCRHRSPDRRHRRVFPCDTEKHARFHDLFADRLYLASVFNGAWNVFSVRLHVDCQYGEILLEQRHLVRRGGGADRNFMCDSALSGSVSDRKIAVYA